MTSEAVAKKLTTLADDLNTIVEAFPALKAVVKACRKAAEDPSKEPPLPTFKAVSISYEGDSIVVKNTPFPRTRPGFLLKKALNKLGGRLSKQVEAETGEPIYRSAWDKKSGGYKLPKDKEPEVRKACAEQGLTVEG